MVPAISCCINDLLAQSLDPDYSYR